MRKPENIFWTLCIGCFLALKVGTVVALCATLHTTPDLIEQAHYNMSLFDQSDMHIQFKQSITI
ncbi:MAG TPA: hypothetical protein VFF04_02525 [Candidatus Babeliales bacterium]|nr:hypothetical protein [Candidatus Babeliales bacterium]